MKKSRVTKIRKELKKGTKTKNKTSKGKIILLITVLLVITIFSVYLVTQNKFVVKTVNVKGNTKYNLEEIIKKSNCLNKNIFTISINDVEKNLKTYPYVEKVIMYKKIPNEIFITITERKPTYYVLNSKENNIVILDKNGIILESIPKDTFSYDTFLIQGINFDDKIKYGEKINSVDLSKLVALENILNEYNNQKIDKKITNIEFDSYKIILTLDEKIKVKIEDTKELEYKMRFLKKILYEIEDVPSEIDMTLDSPLYKKIA